MLPTLSQSSSSISIDENMEYPVLVLTQQPDSHNFNERRIILNETIKVGRSVARARPLELNAIFDCKVLSRNHAIFWFDNGKVWLKDTKSSNGTFVNSQLLSKGTEDSPPREIYSGDIIQFGVEVVENTTTHGCIIAQTTVFLPGGNELRRLSEIGSVTSGIAPISNYYEEQIYQLAQYIQEASHREQTLEKKLTSLSQLIVDTQEASDSSWKVILNQDRLMEKLELLQEQVDIYSKDGVETDSLTLELRRVLEQRYGLERESKSLLEGLIDEKADVLQRVADLEQSLGASEEECSQLRVTLETLQCEHGHISERLSSGKNQVANLQKQLQEAQIQYQTEIGLLCADKEAMTTRYEQLCSEVDQLRTKLDDAENELARCHSDVIFAKQEDAKRLREDLTKMEIEMCHCQDILQKTSNRQMDLDSSMLGIQSQLSSALVTEILALQNLNLLEGYMEDSESSLHSFIVGTTSELGLHFIESHNQIRNGMELIVMLRDELKRLQGAVGDGMEAGILVHDMEDLVDKMDDVQARSKTLLAQIPEKLIVQASLRCDSPESFGSIGVQTDIVTTSECSVQQEPNLDECLESLSCESQTVNSLKADLQHMKDENSLLQTKCLSLAAIAEELRQETKHQTLDCGSDNLNLNYEELFTESEDLRRRVQEIELEMSEKRREYETLWSQYESMVSDADDLRAMREICSRQRSEIEELRYSMDDQYQAVLARSRQISALAVVPLCVLLLGLIVSIVSFLGRPWLLVPSP